MLKLIFNFISDFFGLLFPRTCIACENNLQKAETSLCLNCLYDIPRTDFHKKKDNPVANLFNENMKPEYASSFFYFEKGSKFQSVIHKLKYHNQPLVGIEMGKLFASEIVAGKFSNIDIIIPVPLHPKKMKIRGYNQSEMLANGFSEIFCKEVDTKSVIRTIFTDTQTRKSKEERKKNVSSVFKVVNPENLKNKHILLIDDVITTGATLISLAETILRVENTKFSIVTLAAAIDR